MSGQPWDTNHPGYRDIFNAALTGILANPQFFGSHFQGEPKAAVDFASSVVLSAIAEPSEAAHEAPPESGKGSISHQVEMAVVREKLRTAAIPADSCGTDCDCTSDCERAFSASRTPPEAAPHTDERGGA